MSVTLQETTPKTLPQVPGEPYRLSVAQYHQMTQMGILTKSDRVELLEGRLIRLSTATSATCGIFPGSRVVARSI